MAIIHDLPLQLPEKLRALDALLGLAQAHRRAIPRPSKATRAYLHAERDIEDALREAGWRVANRGFISTQFYFAKLFEAVPVASSS